MSLIDAMQTLKDGITTTTQKRKQDLKSIRQDAKGIQHHTKKMISDFARTRKDNAERIGGGLTAFAKDLTGDINSLRKDFRQQQEEVKKEILTANNIWQGKTSISPKQKKKSEGK